MIWVMIFLFFLFMIMGVPIAFSLALSSSLYILYVNIPLSMVAQKLFSTTQSFPFLAVPFFILSGTLMVESGIARKIINFANTIVGRLPGALGCVSCVVSMIMAGVSGSSGADAASTGSILIPEMRNRGYTASFSVAVNATTSVVGIIIPPSSTMIIIACITNLSVLKLFLAGAIPGIIIGLSYLVLIVIMSIRRNFPREKAQTWKEMYASLKECTWVVIFPFMLFLAIIFGVATVTEIAAVAALYSFLIGFFVYRSLHFNGLKRSLVTTATSTAAVMALVCSANIFTWVLIRENIPQLISKAVLSLNLPNNILLGLLLIILLLAGMVVDVVPNLFIFIPIFFPIAQGMGMDQIHFATVMLVALALGLFTPPVGGTLFISLRIANISIEEVYQDIIPFFIVGAIIVFLIAYIPELCIWFPNVFLP